MPNPYPLRVVLSIRQAIVSASRLDSKYSNVAQSIVGAMFLGTPHRGSGVATWGAMLASLELPGFINENRILNELQEQSGTLTDRLHDFSRWLFSESVPVVCCFETQPTDYSSRLGFMRPILKGSFRQLVRNSVDYFAATC